MAQSMDDILHPDQRHEVDPDFPHAPDGWSRAKGETRALEEGVEIGEDHWGAVRALHEYFAKADSPNVRQLHDALDEKFHAQGGIRYLYLLFPGGPVAQGCRIAGLEAPAGAQDKGFGSVQ